MNGIGLDEHKKLDKLEAAAQFYLDDGRVKEIVERLVNSSAPVQGTSDQS